MKALKALMIAALVMPHIALAIERNDLQSCYETAQLPELKPTSSGRELIVVVDETVPVPEDIQKQAWGQITRFVQPGDSIKLYSFSAFLPGEYLRLIYAGKLDKNIGEEARDDASARKLRTLTSAWPVSHKTSKPASANCSSRACVMPVRTFREAKS